MRNHKNNTLVEEAGEQKPLINNRQIMKHYLLNQTHQEAERLVQQCDQALTIVEQINWLTIWTHSCNGNLELAWRI
jgi:hypothetical protein